MRSKIRDVIFNHNTPMSRGFDIILLILIVISIIIVMLDSVVEFNARHHESLYLAEWTITILFSIEYILRIWTSRTPVKYIFSFYGIIDLLSILPTFLSIFFAQTAYLSVIRALRLLRIFRILKLSRFLGETTVLVKSLKASRIKITIFLFTVLTSVIILGSIMYIVEGEESGFSNIPISIYWAVVTLTTVGYGDIAPITTLGRFIASIVMILGYGIIAVPTGIVSAEMINLQNKKGEKRRCKTCKNQVYREDSQFCRICGATLNELN